MKIKALFASAAGLVFFILGTIIPLEAQQGFTVKKDVFVAAGEVQDNIIAFGGSVVVEGRVKENVVAMGGTILISGEVGDSVVGIGSCITLKPTASIKGDVVSIGGNLEKEQGSRVAGDTVYFKVSEIGGRLFKGGLFKGLLTFPFLSIFIIIKLISVFLWLLAALAVAALFPQPIIRASEHVRKSFWPVFGTGVLGVIVFSGLIILSILLCFILIGIPLLMALGFIGLMIKIFGRVVLFFFFGESLLKALNSKRITVVGATLAGLVLVSLVSLIPFLGFLFMFVLSIIGWGVALRTKFGTTDNWLVRKKDEGNAAILRRSD